eukprot:33485-Pleurochrysis_carterae.AAC.1
MASALPKRSRANVPFFRGYLMFQKHAHADAKTCANHSGGRRFLAALPLPSARVACFRRARLSVLLVCRRAATARPHRTSTSSTSSSRPGTVKTPSPNATWTQLLMRERSRPRARRLSFRVSEQ